MTVTADSLGNLGSLLGSQQLDNIANRVCDDLRRTIGGLQRTLALYLESIPVHFFGRTGGVVPTPQEIQAEVKKIMHKEVEK